MHMEILFTNALGLTKPWFVTALDFDMESKTLKLEIDFEKGARFDYDTEQGLAVHDSSYREWQHLNFFEYKTILRARVPRVKTSEGKVKTVQTPWARASSGFTLLMEAHLLLLCRALPVLQVERLTGVSDNRIWRLLRTHVKQLWEAQDWSSLERLGVDETSTKKGHNYGTAFVEVIGEEDKKGHKAAKVARLLFFTPGKGKETFEKFSQELDKREIKREKISEIAMDMSKSFRAGAAQEFPEAKICFDRYHVMQLAGKACDKVRKEVAKEYGKLPKGSHWALRGNEERLSDKAQKLRTQLCKEYKTIGRALAIKDFLSELWTYATKEEAQEHLKRVISWASRCRLEPFKKLARSLKEHAEGVLGYYPNHTTSAAIEALNGKLQLAKRLARGYRNFDNFQAVAYLIAGGLPLSTPV